MRAVDTDVIVQLIVRDDPQQVASAEAFVASGIWISLVALVEAIWTVRRVHQHPPSRLAVAVEMLLNTPQVTLQDREVVVAALDAFKMRPALGFTDCVLLELARKAGHLPLGPFDRKPSED